jgi:integrase
VTPVRQITAGAIRQAAIVLMPKAKGATRNRQVIVPTMAIINHAATLDLCHSIRVKRFPVVKVERDHASWGWVQAFMAAANPHLGALACFMFLTGARISEALAMTWEDVGLNERTALIRQTKIGAERRAHLPAPLVAALANIESNREPDAPVFKYSSRDTAKPQWRKAIRRAKIKPLSYHACRHGFATAMLQAGVDPITTAKRGGWKSPAHLFSTYGHAMDDETVTDRIIDTNSAQPFLQTRKRAIKTRR